MHKTSVSEQFGDERRVESLGRIRGEDRRRPLDIAGRDPKLRCTKDCIAGYVRNHWRESFNVSECSSRLEKSPQSDERVRARRKTVTERKGEASSVGFTDESIDKL